MIDLEDLKKICLPRRKIVSLLDNVFFDDILRKAYVLYREKIDNVEFRIFDLLVEAEILYL